MENIRLILSMGLIAVISYLIGCLNFAIIICKIMYGKDIRDFGSGNAGMTNVARTFGKVPAILTTIGDFLKGTIAMLAGQLIHLLVCGTEYPYYAKYFVCVMVLIGHAYPVLYNFRGGKGILVSAGVILILDWRILIILCLIFGVVFFTTRIVSLGSIIVAVMFAVLTLVFGLVEQSPHVWTDTLTTSLMAAFVLYLHRANIKRLLNGTEHRFGGKKK